MKDLKPIPLSELMEALDFDFEGGDFTALIDLQNAAVVHVNPAAFDDPQEWLEDYGDEIKEDSDEQLLLEHAVATDKGGERFILPPGKFDYHEYEKMRDFIEDLPDENAADQLRQAIRGKGAFRYFKDTVHRLGLLDQWYAYRHQTMKDFVIQWANARNVPYRDDT